MNRKIHFRIFLSFVLILGASKGFSQTNDPSFQETIDWIVDYYNRTLACTSFLSSHEEDSFSQSDWIHTTYLKYDSSSYTLYYNRKQEHKYRDEYARWTETDMFKDWINFEDDRSHYFTIEDVTVNTTGEELAICRIRLKFDSPIVFNQVNDYPIHNHDVLDIWIPSDLWDSQQVDRLKRALDHLGQKAAEEFKPLF